MCTQRPFTLQVISKIYFLTFASYIEKFPETAIKYIYHFCDGFFRYPHQVGLT